MSHHVLLPLGGRMKMLMQLSKLFEQASIEDALSDARILMLHATKQEYWQFIRDGKEPLEETQLQQLISMANERLEGKPVQYIIGKAPFMNIELEVNSHVLIPRRDTEILALEALERMHRTSNVLDLCTGSGAVALALKYNMPSAKVTATDINQDALHIAKENAERLALSVTFYLSDMFENVPEETYDIITCNPPYIGEEEYQTLMREVKHFEPKLALDGGSDGLRFYRILAEKAQDYLKEGGSLLLEIGYRQDLDVENLLQTHGWKEIEIYEDLESRPRVVSAKKGTTTGER